MPAWPLNYYDIIVFLIIYNYFAKINIHAPIGMNNECRINKILYPSLEGR